MFHFGDELIIDSYRIPWLIWIQLLTMFLLLILLYYFTTSPSDLPTATPSVSSPYANHLFLASAAPNTHQSSKDSENEIKEIGTSTSQVVQRAKRRDVGQMEGPSTKEKEGDGTMVFERSHHPCHLFGLAKQAFLKCLGIDSTPENSSRRRKDKDDS